MAGNMTLAGNSEFKSWVSQLKKDIRSAQVKAAIKVISVPLKSGLVKY